MKILVFSDSHGDILPMCEAVERERPDHMIHLGDMVSDGRKLAQRFPQIPMEQVCGNCDGIVDTPEKKVLELEGRKILMTHGHIYQVKTGIGTATLAAREAGVDILLFGHTHEPLCDYYDGLWILNPGSCRRPLWSWVKRAQGTYGIINFDRGKVECRIAECRTADM